MSVCERVCACVCERETARDVAGGEWRLECEVWSVECEVCSVECGVWSVECEVWSVECGVWSVELKMILPAEMRMIRSMCSALPATRRIIACRCRRNTG